MNISQDDLRLISNTIKCLGMDAVQKAKSGHPGIVMGCSDIVSTLWFKIMKHNPEDPSWINRDRFILSAGHGSMLLYSLLHLNGYNISLDDIKNFRQLGSKTPGHPEFEKTLGIETTTGPLGQGFANGVGMAYAAKYLAEEFNGNDESILNHFIYGLVSDGDINEGVANEAASIAGHLGLGNLIYIYDSNHITIEGDTNLAFSEDVKKKFEAMDWDVQEIDGHNFDEIEKAVLNAQKVIDKPSIIIATTQIAKGSPNMEGSEKTHGAPLGEDEVKATKKNIGFDENASFFIDDKIYDISKQRIESLKEEYNNWQQKKSSIITGDLQKKWDNYFNPIDTNSIEEKLPYFSEKMATRSASGKILTELFDKIPGLLGGSADLGPSNNSFIKGYSSSGKGAVGRNIHYGIREHAMGAIQNGMAYYGGFIPYTATFLVFMDYMRPPIRLAALSKLQTVYIFTHDSIFVGEDGPTHQPVEHLAAARAIPNLTVIRPADANETREAWIAALKNSSGPTILSLSRQSLPVITDKTTVNNVQNGAYIIYDTDGEPDAIILSSGSEVSTSVEAAKELKSKGKKIRVVSFPSWELFDKMDSAYKEKILMHGKKKIVVEAGLRMGWEKYAGNHALYITMESFGASAPYSELEKHFGFSADQIIEKIENYLNN